MLLEFLGYVYTDKPHLKSGPDDENLFRKWETLARKLSTKTPTKWQHASGPKLSTKFRRLKDDISTKYGLEQEGQNLSGLAENGTELEVLMMDILQEENQKSTEKAAVNAAEEKRSRNLLQHERIIVN